MALPPVRLTNPIGNTLLVLFDNINRIIGAAPINDDVLEVWIVLIDDRKNSFFNILPLVVRGGNNRYFLEGASLIISVVVYRLLFTKI